MKYVAPIWDYRVVPNSQPQTSHEDFAQLWAATAKISIKEIIYTTQESYLLQWSNNSYGLFGNRYLIYTDAVTGAAHNCGAYYTPLEVDADRANIDALTYSGLGTVIAASNEKSGIFVRGSGAAGAETAYVFYQSDYAAGVRTIGIGKLVAGTFTSLATTTVSNVGFMFFRASAQGTALKLKVWSPGTLDAAEPVGWDISITDASIAAAGKVGIWTTASATKAGFVRDICMMSFGTGGDSAPIPRNMLDFDTWNNNADVNSETRALLAELTVLAQTGGTGVEQTVLLSNRPFFIKSYEGPYPSQPYDDLIESFPTFTARASDQLVGEASVGYGDLIVMNDGTIDHWTRWNWDGRACKILLGDSRWPRWDFRRVLSLTVSEVYCSARNRIGFKLRDRSIFLRRKTQTALIGGSTANANNPKPFFIGMVFNATPPLEVDATKTYVVHDGALSGSNRVPAVRDRGAALTQSFTNPPSAGNYYLDQANGTIILGSTPLGGLTFDGNTGNNDRHGTLIAGVVDRVVIGGAPYDLVKDYLAPFNAPENGDLAGFKIAGSAALYEAGLYVDKESIASELTSEIAKSIGGFTVMDRYGQLCAFVLKIPTQYPAFEIIEDDMTREGMLLSRLIIPAKSALLGYQKNFTPQSPADLAGVASTPSLVALYGAEALFASSGGGGGLDNPDSHLLARETMQRVTLLADATDASDESGRLFALWGSTRAIFSFTLKRWVGRIYIGAPITVTSSRWGFTSATYGQVLGMEENLQKNQTRVEVLLPYDGQNPTYDGTPYVPVTEVY